MNNLFNNILVSTSSEITVSAALIAMAAAVILGGTIAFTYYKIKDGAEYQTSFAVALLMLPVIMAVIILFVGSNIARAFSLAGTLSIIRFRSAPGDPEDIGFIFFDIAAGLACGVGLYGYGAVFVIFLCIVLTIAKKSGIFEKREAEKTLRITIPEDLNYSDAFSDILDDYTSKYSLDKVKTSELGSVFELYYSVLMQKGRSEQEFINELRCRNGNLNIMLMTAPKTMK